jgi:phage terminase small subunit
MAERSKLTLKQQTFVRAYLETANGSEAYRRAYHAREMKASTIKVKACNMLKRDNIRVTIAAEQAKIAQRHNLTVDRIISELALIGFANMLDYMTLQADGSVTVDLSNLTRDQAAAIQDITVDEYMDGRGRDARPVKRIKFKLSDKRAALVDLGKHLGMFKELSDSTHKVDATNAFLDIVKAMSAARQPKLIEGQANEAYG